MGDYHVRFREKLGVKFPGFTRPGPHMNDTIINKNGWKSFKHQ